MKTTHAILLRNSIDLNNELVALIMIISCLKFIEL